MGTDYEAPYEIKIDQLEQENQSLRELLRECRDFLGSLKAEQCEGFKFDQAVLLHKKLENQLGSDKDE